MKKILPFFPDLPFFSLSLMRETSRLTILLDNTSYFFLTRDLINGIEYTFDKAQFFIMNVAVGGKWQGSPDANTTFPQMMIVDYIRVYQE